MPSLWFGMFQILACKVAIHRNAENIHLLKLSKLMGLIFRNSKTFRELYEPLQTSAS